MEGKYVEGMGNVRISEEVISTIVAVAALEVKGVVALMPRPASDIKGLLPGKKTPSKNVRVDEQNGQEMCIRDRFDEMLSTGKAPGVIVEEKGLAQVNDEQALLGIVEEVLAANAGPVQDYYGGKTNEMCIRDRPCRGAPSPGAGQCDCGHDRQHAGAIGGTT